MSTKSKWNKIQSSFIVHHINYCTFLYFQYNNIPPGSISIASATGHFDYLYACIHHLTVEDFVVEIHHGHFYFFVNAFIFKFLFYRSYTFLFTGYFSSLTEPGFFPCVYRIISADQSHLFIFPMSFMLRMECCSRQHFKRKDNSRLVKDKEDAYYVQKLSFLVTPTGNKQFVHTLKNIIVALMSTFVELEDNKLGSGIYSPDFSSWCQNESISVEQSTTCIDGVQHCECIYSLEYQRQQQ